MNASNNDVRTSSTPGQSSSLRPRNRRLISGLEEGDDATVTDSTSQAPRRTASPLPSPFESRSTSPLPPGHLSRPKRNNADARRYNVARRTGTESPTSLAALWGSSWTTLQSMASDLLGNEEPDDEFKGKPAGRVRRPLDRLQSQRASTSAPPSQWGPAQLEPAPDVGIGVGTKEEREAAIRAQKRKDILTGAESGYADNLGRFKRRTSDDRTSSAPPGDNEDRPALAYLHHVSKNDTLAGITIKYNISANALRKANRMWPNDTVQARKTLILPVDACGVKGKPVDGSDSVELLGEESAALSSGQAEEVSPLQNGGPDGASDKRTRTNSTSTNTINTDSTEKRWYHDSWTLLPAATKPTEIVRLSRLALGYFPPARRKSNSQPYSDLDTPSDSLDLTRTSSSSHTSNPSADSPQRPRRGRRPSNATNGYYPSYLSGPGGVGTFNRNVRAPGPAQDGLNKMFAPHLPDVAPPKNQQNLYQPEVPLYSDSTPGVSGSTTPTAGIQIDLNQIGGAVEGWARKWAGKAQKGLLSPGAGPATAAGRRGFSSPFVTTPGRPGTASGGGGAGGQAPWGNLPGGVSGVGDLIEMTDEFEIGGDEEDEGRGRREGHAEPSSSGADYFGGAGVQTRVKGGKKD